MRLIVLAIVLCAAASATMSQPLVFKKGPSGIVTTKPPVVITQFAAARLTRPDIDDIVFVGGLVLAPQRDGTLVNISATFLPPGFNTGEGLGSVFGDFNGDGRLDIFSGGGQDEFGDPAVMSTLLLSQPDGTYGDASALLPADTQNHPCLGVGDVNGDGYLDISVGNAYFLLNNGGTSFTRTSSNLPPDVASLQSYSTCALADIDGDGHPDLIFGSNARAPSVILLNDGHGDFTRRPPMPLPPGLFDGPDLNTLNQSYVAIDLNGDGLPDLVVSQTQKNPAYSGHAIQALINDGHGGFTDQTSAYIRNAVDPAHNWIPTLAVADLNGDGIPDIYVEGIILHRDHTHPPINPPIFAWVSDGLGHWNPMTLQDLDPNWDPDQPINYLFTDIDGDGLPDLILLTSNSFDDADPHFGEVTYQVYFNVTPKPTPSRNYEGMWWAAPAGSESGWGINLAHQGDVIFATWFTYDATGKALWLSMTTNKTADGVYSGTLYQTHGPAFSAVPFSPAAVSATPVGSGILTFSEANNGTFAYIVNGIAQTKAITREIFGPLPTCTFGAQPNLALATNYQDLWYAAPAESEAGWGVNFTHQGDIIFATWFTYDVDGTPLWLVATINKTGPGAYTGTLYRTTGPAFNAVPFLPANVGVTEVGTLTLSFANGNSATFAYTVNGVMQSKVITRQVFRTPGTMCH